ncbi:PcfJ domain-containing protein [Paenibacillus agilis]|uniref:PcfJ domain-containing protein n=1 Tax=Paenibacillus agilis TaxID=3020863 RepID=UPI0021BD2397|nr:PcfJ domain-containing protein [Paenibacillus agilis]
MVAKESTQTKVKELKDVIRNFGYEKYEDYGNGRYIPKDKLIGTMYMVERMDYGFHIYYIHEPSESNKIAGKDGIVTEMYYDLRNKMYWIKRNTKDVQFSARNVDSIFPYDRMKRKEVFDFLSTKGNEGLYESAYQYLGAMGMERTEMFGRFFHRLITEYSYYELLHKAGIKVDSNLCIVNINGKSPMEILGLSKTQWKMFNKFGISIGNLQCYRHNETGDNRMINQLNHIKSLDVEYGIEKIKEFSSNEMSYIYTQGTYYDSALQTAKRYGLPEKHLIRYLYYECDVSQGLSVGTALSQYRDYIRMANEMGYERFDRYPKFLRTYHDIVARNYKVKLNAEEQKQWDEICEKNAIYKYAMDGFRIFTPMTTQDLVREGNVLGHCVGSYVGKVRQGTSVIAFLRDADDVDKPLVTIEIRDKAIVQAKAKMNNPPTTEQKDFIEKFAKKFELEVKSY